MPRSRLPHHHPVTILVSIETMQHRSASDAGASQPDLMQHDAIGHRTTNWWGIVIPSITTNRRCRPDDLGMLWHMSNRACPADRIEVRMEKGGGCNSPRHRSCPTVRSQWGVVELDIDIVIARGVETNFQLSRPKSTCQRHSSPDRTRPGRCKRMLILLSVQRFCAL
jgi:hypothetical protein